MSVCAVCTAHCTIAHGCMQKVKCDNERRVKRRACAAAAPRLLTVRVRVRAFRHVALRVSRLVMLRVRVVASDQWLIISIKFTDVACH